MKAPIGRVDARKLFHFIYSGLKDSIEPPGSQRFLAIADLCKILDMGSKVNKKRERSHDAVPTKQQAAAKQSAPTVIEENPFTLRNQNATIESSEAKTYMNSSIQ